MGVCDELGKLKAKGESSVSSSVVFWMVQLIELLFQVARKRFILDSKAELGSISVSTNSDSKPL